MKYFFVVVNLGTEMENVNIHKFKGASSKMKVAVASFNAEQHAGFVKLMFFFLFFNRSNYSTGLCFNTANLCAVNNLQRHCSFEIVFFEAERRARFGVKNSCIADRYNSEL